MDATLLAIDSSSEGCSVALSVAGSLTCLRSDEPRSHAKTLLPLIDSLLANAKLSLAELDAIALVHGPGSFTGIRIALSVAQGLAYGANLPLIGVSSLRTLAELALPILTQPCSVVCAIDARMGEVYWQAFAFDGQDIREINDVRVDAFDEFNLALAAMLGVIVGVGSAYKLDAVNGALLSRVEPELEPTAEAVLAVLAKEKNLDELKCSVVELEPLYLRNEVAWQKRQRIRREALKL